MEELVQSNMKFLEIYVVDFLSHQNRSNSNLLVFDVIKKNKDVKELFKKVLNLKLLSKILILNYKFKNPNIIFVLGVSKYIKF